MQPRAMHGLAVAAASSVSRRHWMRARRGMLRSSTSCRSSQAGHGPGHCGRSTCPCRQLPSPGALCACSAVQVRVLGWPQHCLDKVALVPADRRCGSRPKSGAFSSIKAFGAKKRPKALRRTPPALDVCTELTVCCALLLQSMIPIMCSLTPSLACGTCAAWSTTPGTLPA